MNDRQNCEDSLLAKGDPSANIAPKQEMADVSEVRHDVANSPAPMATNDEKPDTAEATKQHENADGSASPSVDHEPRTAQAASSVAEKSVSKKPQSFLRERPLPAIEMARRVLRYRSRR